MPPAEPAPAPAPAPAPPGYYQPVQPVMYGPPPQRSLHNGMTFEANLGFGWIHASASGDSDTSDLGLAGLSIGIGGWVNPKVALTGRIAGITLVEDDARFSHIFFGPSLQYWVDDHIWFGGGIGLSIAAIANRNDGDSTSGLGFDLRAGYTFNSSTENTVNVSIELNPGHYSEGSGVTLTGIGFLLGYQHL